MQEDLLVDQWISKAKIFFGEEKYAEALECCSQALKMDPNHKDAWLSKGNIFFHQKKYAEAQESLDHVLKLDPNDEWAWKMKADIFVKQEKYSEALECHDKRLKCYPDDKQIWRDKANIFEKQSRYARKLAGYDKEMECYDQILKLDPKDKRIWRRKADIFVIQKKDAEALECYDQILKFDANDISSWGDKGNILKVQKKYAEALECYDQILKIDPNDKFAWENKADIFEGQEKYAEALECYNQRLRNDPKDKHAWNKKASIFVKQEKYSEALECYDQILKFDANDRSSWRDKGDIFKVQKKYTEALECYDTQVRINPQDDFSWRRKAEIFRLQRNYVAMRECYDGILRAHPLWIDTWCEKADSFREEGNFPEAFEVYTAALKIALDPEGIQEILNKKGILFEQQKMYKEALACYENALKVKDPELDEVITFTEAAWDAWYNKGRVLFIQKKHDAALACFEEILRDVPTDFCALQGKAVWCLWKGDKEEAQKLLEAVNASMDEDTYSVPAEKLWCDRGDLFCAIEEFFRAQECFEKAQSIFPYDFYTNKRLLEINATVSEISKKSLHPSSQTSSSKVSDSFSSSPLLSLHAISWKELVVGELIGNGGFGEVHKAKWYEKEVAVKTLHLKTLSEDMKKIFDQEAEVMAKCSFPHVVRLYGICTEVGHYAMVIEFMTKGSLYHVLHNAQIELPWAPLRWQISLDTARGLSYLHGNDILHRDLKSLNILLDEKYAAKISDFGLAKTKVVSSSASSKSANKGLAGSVRWSAPELLDEDSSATQMSDIYSFGMVLWEIASRKLPYEETQKEMMVVGKLMKGIKEKIPPETPEFYGKLIQRMWQAPEERPQAKEVLDVLIQNPPPVEEKVALVEKSWHFDAEIPQGKENYYLIPAGEKDNRKVVEFYHHHPVPGMDIQRVEIIYNAELNRGFVGRMRLLQQRSNKPAFQPKWEKDNHPEWRKEVDLLSKELAKPYIDLDCPNVQLLPLWHGTRPEVMSSIFETGYANLATTDSGFFGKGLYSAYEAEYSHRVYSKGALILNWVAFFSAYPVIDGDMDKLSASANYGNHDAHFVPVVPQNPNNPHETVYYPTKPKQKHTYTEVVVFEAAQCLPRYVVHLQKVLLNSHGFFKQSHKQIDLFETAKYVYAQYLSKPYTLKASNNTKKNMTTMDWDYKQGGIVVQRPNHGLAHVLRKACYVPFVLKYFMEFNKDKLTPELISEVEKSIPEIQLAILFTVTGRENDSSNHDDNEDYFMFRRKSAELFENYVKDQKLLISAKRLALYIDSIRAFDYTKSPFHSIMTICHMIDTVRCFKKDLFNTIMDQVAAIVGVENKNKLVQLAYHAVLKTGDRVMGMNDQKSYQGKLFIDCSQNVETCVKNINVAVKEWSQSIGLTNALKPKSVLQL